jgi:rare lipoprotein A
MTKTNRLTFVVSLVLMSLGALACGTATAQGLLQHTAMWHPQQWSEYRPAAPDTHWGSGPESAPAQTKPANPAPQDAKRAHRRGSKSPVGKTAPVEQRASKAKAFRNRGIASWYGKRFHGRKTASGQRFDMHALTAAHRTLPLPSYVRVTNPTNGASVVVLVNDRGPYARNRVMDLSYAAANALGITKRGTAMVALEVVATPRTTLASAATVRVPGEESLLAAEATAFD